MIEFAVDMCVAQAEAGEDFAFECAELVDAWQHPWFLRWYKVSNAHNLS